MSSNEYKERFPDEKTLTDRVSTARAGSSTKNASWHEYGGCTPDDKLMEFMAGSLLGDGSLEKCHANARYCEGGSNERYLRWKHELLSKYFPTSFQEKLSSPHVKSGKRYIGWWVRTTSHPLLTDLHEHWYRPKKLVYREFIEQHLTTFSLAIWFFDDGHLEQSSAYLYPMAFSEEDVTWLVGLLKRKFALVVNVYRNHQGQSLLGLRAKHLDHFLALISPHTVPGMEYKTRRGGPERVTCQRCGHQWFCRKNKTSERCPNKSCTSPYWK